MPPGQVQRLSRYYNFYSFSEASTSSSVQFTIPPSSSLPPKIHALVLDAPEL